NKPEESRKKFVEALETILKDRWAFWLDEAKEKIDAVETSYKKNALLKEYNNSFIKELTKLLEGCSLDDLFEKFVEKPEETIQIGKVCLSEKDFDLAKKCFEKGIQCGDISGFANIGLAFSIIQLNAKENVKKQSRKQLKKVIYSLEAVKRNLMANLKIAEILPPSTVDVLKTISSKENYYQEQITGKLEVIGLHLHYLRKAVGDIVEPYDFILQTNEEQKSTKENAEKGEKLYDLLVQGGIIYGDRIRKAFRNDSKERANMENIIRDNIDPAIADPLISLLERHDNFKKEDFEKINKKDLPQKYENVWKEIQETVDPKQVDRSIFDGSTEKNKFKVYLEQNQILTQTKRIKIDELNFNSLRFDHQKYAKVKFNDNGHETKDLKTFLIELQDSIKEHSEYFYQTDLPYGTREEEGNKIRIFLKDKNILKSGGLAIHNYGNKQEEIDKLLDEILEDSGYKNDKKLIQSKLSVLQGGIRSYKDSLKATLTDFTDLPDQEIVPTELNFFQGLALNKFLIIKEDKSWWDWNAFAVAMIELAQVIAGAVLISFGAVNIGGALVAEGISDMVYATMAGLSGNFSWRDWAIQKAISFSISIATAGIGNIAAKLGLVSRAALFAQILKGAAYEFATTCLTNILTNQIMEQVQEGVVQKIVNGIETNFLEEINQSISNKSNGKNMKGTLGKNTLLPKQFDNIRIQVVSALENSYDQFAEGLNKSSSKYAKMAATAIKTTVMIDQMWSLVQSVVRLNDAISTIKQITEGSINTTNQNAQTRELNDTLVKARADQLSSILKAHISQFLTRELDRVLRQVIRGTLKKVGQAVVQSTKNQQAQTSVEQPSLKQDSQKDEQDKARREDLQNNIKNPKIGMENHLDEMKDKDRGLGIVDVKMLVNSERRNLILVDSETGKEQVINPEGPRKIPAFFKQSAKIMFKPDENGDIGHFITARGEETYIQVNGRTDCLLIAYNESLGRKVDEDMIENEREKLVQYTVQHSKTFERYKKI
ncbi:unnamed protein product, partial [Didymodactylos carnosus]